MIERQEFMTFAKRVLGHAVAGTTELAGDSYRVAVRAYSDEARFAQEVDAIFKRRPLLLGFSCEIREPNTYRALNVVGVPVLLTRSTDGVVRAFLNVCTHRGARVADEATERGRRLACPYHGWTYDLEGALVGIPSEAAFGTVDEVARTLRPLPVEERSGMIFGVLTPGIALDLDDWLGEVGPMLDRLGLESFHFFERRYLKGPGWKIAMDGYHENYHFLQLHRNTFAKNALPNLNCFDLAGPHKRFLFARRTITDLLDIPEEKWVPSNYVGHGYNLFPNTQMAFGFVGEQDELTPGQQMLVSQVFPTSRPGESITHHTVLTAQPVRTDEFRKATEQFLEETFAVVRDEDYWVGGLVQDGLASGANEHFTFGRMELGLHHFHTWIDNLVLDSVAAQS